MKADLRAQIQRLPSLGTRELRRMWREMMGNQPHSRLRRELLIPILAYRLQEQALGGLKPATARRLRTIADELASGKPKSRKVEHAPQLGTRMVRQWRGKLHEVVKLESGFLYEGEKYGSLSELARSITGTRWSGPAFFGLKKRTAREAA